MTDILAGLQIDQLKLHVTQMLRRLDALESEVRELRGVTRMITPIGPKSYSHECTYDVAGVGSHLGDLEDRL